MTSASARRLGSCALVAIAALVALAGDAVAEERTIESTVGGWYQREPTCVLPTGCGEVGGLASPWPERTLHVGSTAGRETARSYLQFPFETLDTDVAAAILTVPLDTSVEAGSFLPESSAVQLCAVRVAIQAVDASTEEPPATDCTVAVPMSYRAEPTPALHADLTSVLPGLRSATGIALLPGPLDGSPSEAWRVVFSAHDRTAENRTPAPYVTVTLAEASMPNAPVDGDIGEPSPSTGGAPRPLPVPGVAATTSPSPQPTIATSDVAAAIDPVTTVLEAAPGSFAYSSVLLLPFALVGLVVFAGRALTRDLGMVHE